MNFINKKEYNRNLGETWLTREQIVFSIFTKENLLEEKYKRVILDLIKEVEILISPDKFNLIRFGWGKNYFVNLTKNNFEKFKKDFLNFKYFDSGDARTYELGYEIDIKENGGKKTSIGDIRIYIEIDSLINYSSSPYLRGKSCHEISLFLPLDFPRKDEIIHLLKKKFIDLNCVYGYINPVLSFNISPVESIWVLSEYTKEKEGIFDIPDNVGNSEYYNNKIKGTQWGNFLTKEHIKQLRGIQNIKNNLKDFIIQEISDKCVYIQMPIALSFDKKILVPYHKKLASFFAPIYIPRWSGSRTFSGVNEYFLRRFL